MDESTEPQQPVEELRGVLADTLNELFQEYRRTQPTGYAGNFGGWVADMDDIPAEFASLTQQTESPEPVAEWGDLLRGALNTVAPLFSRSHDYDHPTAVRRREATDSRDPALLVASLQEILDYLAGEYPGGPEVLLVNSVLSLFTQQEQGERHTVGYWKKRYIEARMQAHASGMCEDCWDEAERVSEHSLDEAHVDAYLRLLEGCPHVDFDIPPDEQKRAE
jgi:hypothetical protein